ncbi:hypothetical protein OK016_25265 [Vibrio chagasii]|nr:hypothetical protein [Vibrio chagasii]
MGSIELVNRAGSEPSVSRKSTPTVNIQEGRGLGISLVRRWEGSKTSRGALMRYRGDEDGSP